MRIFDREHLTRGKNDRVAVAAPAWPALPSFEYETNIINTDAVRLDQLLNAKAALGWRVHTCQQVEAARFFLVFERLKRGE